MEEDDCCLVLTTRLFCATVYIVDIGSEGLFNFLIFEIGNKCFGFFGKFVHTFLGVFNAAVLFCKLDE